MPCKPGRQYYEQGEPTYKHSADVSYTSKRPFYKRPPNTIFISCQISAISAINTIRLFTISMSANSVPRRVSGISRRHAAIAARVGALSRPGHLKKSPFYFDLCRPDICFRTQTISGHQLIQLPLCALPDPVRLNPELLPRRQTLKSVRSPKIRQTTVPL